MPEIVARANEDHADDVPCVIALPISGGHPEYLKWVYQETRRPQQAPPERREG